MTLFVCLFLLCFIFHFTLTAICTDFTWLKTYIFSLYAEQESFPFDWYILKRTNATRIKFCVSCRMNNCGQSCAFWREIQDLAILLQERGRGHFLPSDPCRPLDITQTQTGGDVKCCCSISAAGPLLFSHHTRVSKHQSPWGMMGVNKGQTFIFLQEEKK